MVNVVAYYTDDAKAPDHPMYASFYRFVMNYIKNIGYYCDPVV